MASNILALRQTGLNRSDPLAGSVPRVPWAQHQALLAETWKPGQHVSIVAPTGEGKSYLTNYGLLPILNSAEKVLIFEDDAESVFPGFSIKVKRVPNRAWREIHRARYGDDYRPVYRLVLPEDLTQKSILQERQRVFQALRTVFKERNWVVVMHEVATYTESLADWGLGLRGVLNVCWRKMRRRGCTVIAETQAARWVPRAFYDQCSLAYLGRVMDTQARTRFKEIGGNSKELEIALASLQKHEFVATADAARILQIVKVGR